MKLGCYLSTLNKPKLEHTKEQLNLSVDEEFVFDLLAKQVSITEIAYRLNVSTRTVDRIIKRIRYKLMSV